VSLPKEIQVGTKGMPVIGVVTDQDGNAVEIAEQPLYRFEDPKGVEIDVDGVIDPLASNTAAYVLQPGDGVAETAGDWRWQVYLVLVGGWSGWTKPKAFKVLHNLGAA
jgi:hypothetical protein